MAISTALDITRVSRAVGYKLKAANFSPNTPYLPQRIAILGEANTANQATLSTDPFEFTTADEVGSRYGYGSPLHQIARILRPLSGNILGGIPTVIYPQEEPDGATAAVIVKSITITDDSASAATTHYLRVNGRTSIDGQAYAVNIEVGDSAADVLAKYIAAANAVSGSPVIAAAATTNLQLTTKWAGATAGELVVEFVTGDEDAGITYAEVSDTGGAGAPSITDSLGLFGETWNTLVINPYGATTATTLNDLETNNGFPDPDTPTGRYLADTWKPYLALFGSVASTVTAIEAITDIAARKDDVTNVLCPAPASKGWTWEAAANVAAVAAPIAQNTPHIGAGGKYYPDMPIPSDSDIGDFDTYDNRDRLVKNGSSTVKLVNGAYQIQDLVTTYHPDGVVSPKYRYVRDMFVYFNNAFGWKIIMVRDIQDKAIAPDNSPIKVGNTISPKQVLQLIGSFAQQQAERALLADIDFTKESAQVGINETNPARLDIFFRIKITSTANIVDATNEVDFNFSN